MLYVYSDASLKKYLYLNNLLQDFQEIELHVILFSWFQTTFARIKNIISPAFAIIILYKDL